MIVGQFFRYVVVGLVSNAMLYALYLVLTWLGMEPKLAMTLAFCVGTLQTFYVNRRWTFRAAGGIGTLARYLGVVATAYGLNWMTMWFLVDRLGYPHQLVQLMLIFVTAVFLFLMFRAWVFRWQATGAPAPARGRQGQGGAVLPGGDGTRRP